jgi:hypothetical protein
VEHPRGVFVERLPVEEPIFVVERRWRQRLQPVQNRRNRLACRAVAGEVERDVIKIPERIAAGRRALEMKETSIASLIPGFVGFETALGKKFAQIGEGKINQKTMEALIKAAESGKNMNELLAVVPAEDRVKVLKVFRNAKDWNSFVTRGAASMGVESDNKLAPTIENKNALAK